MRTAIDDTIKEIIFSVIQFNTDIEGNNPAGLKKFINDFILLLKRFQSLTSGHEADYIDFKAEFSGLFTYLFSLGKIYEVAENLISQKENEGIKGTIIAMIKNGDPLMGNLRISPSNLFKEFVSKYKGLYSEPGPENLNTIIEKERLSLIYRKYKDCFTEPEGQWIKRFVRNGPSMGPIDTDKKALNGSKRLVLLAILAAIQTKTGSGFDYNDFVLNRFGLKNFQKGKSDHKDKPEFQNVLKECNAILKE